MHCPACDFPLETKVIETLEYIGCPACEQVSWTGRIIRDAHPMAPRKGEAAELYSKLDAIYAALMTATDERIGLINDRGKYTQQLWGIARKQAGSKPKVRRCAKSRQHAGGNRRNRRNTAADHNVAPRSVV